MIIGSREGFGIESEITKAISNASQRAIGYFVIHLKGKSYGVKEPDASMLGCSFQEVQDRLGRRGMHRVPSLTDLSAFAIATAFLDAIYRDAIRGSYLGLTESEFKEAIFDAKLQWAPDGDAAFDDGSFVLHFDVQDQVRLIAFQNMECPIDVANSVSELWIEGNEFYGVLSEWSDRFIADWSNQVQSGSH